MAPSRQTRRKKGEKKAEAEEAKRVAEEADRKPKKKRKLKDGTKVVQAILEMKMDVPGSFGTVGSDGEEDDSVGKEEDNGEDLDEDDLTSIDDELDEPMSDTLMSNSDEDT
jgi:hypothetical protein